MATIAFIGLGNMGGPMAANLLRAGHALTVHDLVPAAIERAVAAGARAAGSAAAAIDGAEVVVSMLPASRHVEALYLGEQGLLAQVRPGTLVIDCSTIAPAAARRVGEAAAARGIAMIDAPVSGGVGGATQGTLTFIVGGEAAALERARTLLEAMGRNIFHAGGSGAGQVAKICNNMLLAVLMTGTAEALALGVNNGLDPQVLSEIMKQSSGGNWALNVYNPWPGVMPAAPASSDYRGGFLVDLMIKDLGLAMEAADATASSTPLGALARTLYLMHRREHAAGQLDFSSIQQLFRDPQG